jgi:hypothetical protein
MYRRGDSIFLTPTVGGLDAEPLFPCGPQTEELASALRDVLSATPVIGADQDMTVYRTPAMKALGLKSAAAFERGLKSAQLNVVDSYQFFRFLPVPKFKRGLFSPNQPLWILPRDTPLRDLAEKILATFEDPSWITR